MKIVVESIESKLNEPFFSEFKEIAIASISKYIEAIKEFEASGLRRDLTCFKDNQAEESINAYFCETADEIVNSEVRQVLDALRYSFVCYAYNGLYQLYTRQENECWHPKIVLTEVLEPNDIDSLPPVLTLYRGCDISEFENLSFGQAWSTSLESAKKFAYINYLGQDWFDENSRIVLETRYPRDHVLFSNQSIEYEVVVDVDKLDDVHKHA
ncbi:hypothetical protein [Pseudomonas chlororaphis]|uniref:hypothetical protein n=1 Tax=Pseudomonas chlororaphis TaxID=587753 RepID=UPI0005F8CDB8|nr:hypothetical protein [Pseudomonas chlororaphis]